MRAGRVKRFYIRDTYMIPKEYVIEYVLGEHYEEYKNAFKKFKYRLVIMG